MLGRHVQRVEAVPVVFRFRTFDDGEPHAREDRFELIADDGQRVAMADGGHAAGQRDVDGVFRRLVARVFLVRLPARFDRLLQLVRVASDVFLLIRRRAADQLHP